MSFDPAKGHGFEQEMAGFLGKHGYTVSTNVRVAGRSGAVHELDVIGDKSDGLTSFRVIVECKAWASAIDKEIVYKLAAELADLGAARGIIATLSGWTVQAEQAAVQANIELWGPNELRARLGPGAIHAMRAGWQEAVGALGTECGVSATDAGRALTRMARGRLGLARDELVWSGLVWLPVWSLQLAITRLEGTFRKVPRVTRLWNGYEGLSGLFTWSSPGPPRLVPVDVSVGHLLPQVRAATLEASIKKAYGQWSKVTTAAAKNRYASALAQMGIQLPFTAVSVEQTSLIYRPLWIGFLQKGLRERIAVVDAVTGTEHPSLSDVLTAHAQDVRAALTPKP
jgi:Restriction endonuclease